jgi:hypothetical protein
MRLIDAVRVIIIKIFHLRLIFLYYFLLQDLVINRFL